MTFWKRQIMEAAKGSVVARDWDGGRDEEVQLTVF